MSNPTTAGQVQVGQVIHRVAQAGLSAVFSEPVDALVIGVHRFEQAGQEYVHIDLEPKGVASASSLNLRLDRGVTLA